MNKRVIFISAALAMTLSSCGLYSKYDKQTSVDQNLYGELAAQVGGDSAEVSIGDVSWREIFKDATLQSYIEQGLANNVDLLTAEKRVEQAAASLMTSRLAYLPSLSLAPEGVTGGLVEGGASYNTYSVPVAAAWEIDIFGRLTNTKLKAKMQMEQQSYAAQATRIEIVAAIANLYYTISMLEDQLAIAITTESSWQESYEVAQVMMEAGMMNQAGVAQIKASLYSVQMAVVNLGNNLKATQNAMCSLLSTTPQNIKGGDLSAFVVPENLSMGVPLRLLSSRPDVMAVESALAASFYSENVARSSFYPSITLSGSLGWSNSIGTAILDPAKFIYGVVGQLVQPIFSRGANRAQLKIAQADFEISRMAFEQKLLDAGIEVNDALTSLIATQANTNLYTEQVVALRQAAESTQKLMQHGSTTYLEVLTAQQTLLNAELGEVGNRFDQTQSLIALYKALGGGRF